MRPFESSQVGVEADAVEVVVPAPLMVLRVFVEMLVDDVAVDVLVERYVLLLNVMEDEGPVPSCASYSARRLSGIHCERYCPSHWQ